MFNATLNTFFLNPLNVFGLIGNNAFSIFYLGSIFISNFSVIRNKLNYASAVRNSTSYIVTKKFESIQWD